MGKRSGPRNDGDSHIQNIKIAIKQAFTGFMAPAPQPTVEYRKTNRELLRDLDDGLAEWLLMLELPQLEDARKRDAVARRLSIVLMERLTFRTLPPPLPEEPAK